VIKVVGILNGLLVNEGSMSKSLPKIVARSIAARSQYFSIERLDLEFSNGEQRIYERLAGEGHGAVMLLPVTQHGELLLVREYAAGTHSYELGFPKGLIDAGESAEQAAKRELREEIGMAAHQLHFLKDLTLAPSYFSSRMSVYIAQGLYESPLIGDEPEPLELVTVPMSQLQELLDDPSFSEARSVAALYLFMQWWKNNNR
jgi:ADP-ribose diphosphatase